MLFTYFFNLFALTGSTCLWRQKWRYFCHSFKKKSLTVFISFITKDKDYDVWGYEILLQSDAWNQNILFLTYKSGYINFDENGLFV